MSVPMMDIRKMRMPMPDRLVPMKMTVRAPTLPRNAVPVLMMRIVLMDVGMLDGFVLMIVFVSFGEMKPHTGSHQRQRTPEQRCGRFAEENYRNGGTDEGRSGEVRAGARGPQSAQRQHKQDQAQAVAEKSQQHRQPCRWRCGHRREQQHRE